MGEGTVARVLADSIGGHGIRLVSVESRFPRIILSQFRTYGSLVYSVRSSRAVPTKVMVDEVRTDPFVPRVWRRAQRGMVAGAVMNERRAENCLKEWLSNKEHAVGCAERMANLDCAKEHVNRLLEPFSWSWAVVTGTLPRWEWVFRQRCADDAQPEFRELACAIRDAVRASEPKRLRVGDWHLPYVAREELHGVSQVCGVRVSAARCARVSYTPFDSEQADWCRDEQLADRLKADGHLSPLEHPAMCCATEAFHGKHQGWMSYRTREGY